MPELSLRGSGSGSAQRVEVSGGQGRRRCAWLGPNTARESGTGEEHAGR